MIQISIGRYECAFNVDCLQYYICVPFHCPVPMTVTGCIYTYISITSRQVDKVHKFLKVLHTPNYIICISVYGRQVDKVDKML